MRGSALAILVAGMIFLLPEYLFPYDQNDFDEIVDFSSGIKALSQQRKSDNPSFLKQGKLLLLNGTVSSLEIVNPDQENFLVQVELIAGEWIELEEVRSYRCQVFFQGPEFHPIFPRRLPKKPPPHLVRAGDRVLVVAKAFDQVRTDNGDLIWLLQGYHVRRLH